MPKASNPVDAALWVTERARMGTPMAVAFRGKMCRFCDGEDSVYFDLSKETHRDALKNVCTGSHGVSLVVASLPAAAHDFSKFTGIPMSACAQWIIGDMEALDLTLGTSHTAEEPDEMLRTWKATRGMQLPGYYEKIAVPTQRLKVIELKEGEPWAVSYPNLLAKVIAKYSMEPVLLRDNDLDDPTESFRAVLQGEVFGENDGSFDHESAYDWLIYASTTHPPVGLADAPFEEVDRVLDKVIPILRMRVSQTIEHAYQIKEATTLYGRVLAVDHTTTPEDIMRHTILGTVFDIINVAAVTFVNQGASVKLPKAEGTEERIRIEGTCRKKEKYEWMKMLTQLAPLGGPLAPIGLSPVVITE